MFNKEAFKIKLEFFIRNWHCSAAEMVRLTNEEDTQIISNFLWQKALETLWKTRTDNVVCFTIDNPELFNSFAALLTIGINQMNDRINSLNKSGDPLSIILVQASLILTDQASILADEIDELLKSNHESIRH